MSYVRKGMEFPTPALGTLPSRNLTFGHLEALWSVLSGFYGDSLHMYNSLTV